MRHRLCGGWLGRLFIALILVPAFFAAPRGSAEIFKCSAKDGMALYQNFPCQFDTVGAAPSAKAFSMPPEPSQKPTTAPVTVASTINAADDRKPQIGMTPKEVRAILGEPLEIVQDEPTDGIQTWRYLDRSVQLDRANRVVDVQAW